MCACLGVGRYQFMHDPVTPLYDTCLGACHADDVAFLFQVCVLKTCLQWCLTGMGLWALFMLSTGLRDVCDILSFLPFPPYA